MMYWTTMSRLLLSESELNTSPNNISNVNMQLILIRPVFSSWSGTWKIYKLYIKSLDKFILTSSFESNTCLKPSFFIQKEDDESWKHCTYIYCNYIVCVLYSLMILMLVLRCSKNILGSFSVFKYLIGVLTRVRRAETGNDQVENYFWININSGLYIFRYKEGEKVKEKKYIFPQIT